MILSINIFLQIWLRLFKDYSQLFLNSWVFCNISLILLFQPLWILLIIPINNPLCFLIAILEAKIDSKCFDNQKVVSYQTITLKAPSLLTAISHISSLQNRNWNNIHFCYFSHNFNGQDAFSIKQLLANKVYSRYFSMFLWKLIVTHTRAEHSPIMTSCSFPFCKWYTFNWTSS